MAIPLRKEDPRIEAGGSYDDDSPFLDRLSSVSSQYRQHPDNRTEDRGFRTRLSPVRARKGTRP